jgi:hypothetical protein
MSGSKQPPQLDEETDAEMEPNAQSTWVGVGKFSVYIKRLDGAVSVAIYARGAEDCNSLSECYALDEDADSMHLPTEGQR